MTQLDNLLVALHREAAATPYHLQRVAIQRDINAVTALGEANAEPDSVPSASDLEILADIAVRIAERKARAPN